MARRKHGEAKALQAQEAGAPVAGGTQRTHAEPRVRPQPAPLGGLMAPTERPEEGLSAGLGGDDHNPLGIDPYQATSSDVVIMALMENPALQHVRDRLMLLLES